MSDDARGPKVQGQCPSCGEEMLALNSEGGVVCDAVNCPEPFLVRDLLTKPDQHVHLILFGADGYTAQHPLAERIRPAGLFACPLTDEFNALTAPPGIGMFRIEPGGHLADMEQVDPDEVTFEVPQAPPSPDVAARQQADALASVVPIGAITEHPKGAALPDGWVELHDDRRPLPEQCIDLHAAAIENQWPFFMDDGSPAIPSLADVEHLSEADPKATPIAMRVY